MLYIRHAQKSYSNRKYPSKYVDNNKNMSSETSEKYQNKLVKLLEDYTKYPLDPDITEEGCHHAIVRFSYLLEKFGIPDVIVSSPFLRTRHTAHVAKDIIFAQTGVAVPIICDSLVGEYLGHHKNVDMSKEVTTETLMFNPFPPETWDEFNNRIKSYTRENKIKGWCITHGLVIQKISESYGANIRYPRELSGVYITNDSVNVI
jgi:broad specificity phosphatase PhoE